MVIMSGTATVLQQFVSGLKSRNEDTRAKSAKDLQHYVTTELREVSTPVNQGLQLHIDLVFACSWFNFVLNMNVFIDSGFLLLIYEFCDGLWKHSFVFVFNS